MQTSIAAERAAELPRSFVLDAAASGDPAVEAILRQDVPRHRSPLELIQVWAEELEHRATLGAPGEKLAALFRHGTVPAGLSGFQHGITIAMHTGLDVLTAISRLQRRFGLGALVDPLQVAFGRLLSRTNPWAGKSFAPLQPGELAGWTEGAATGEEAWLGTNRFRRVRGSVTSALATRVIPWMFPVSPLEPPPAPSARSWVYAEGGRFIAQRGRCVDPALGGKEVLDLNYRWRRLGNGAPPRLLRDQLVAVAPGMYLGVLYYATARLLEDYDPKLPDEAYEYRNFGYFLLLDDLWRVEKDRLFPHLACPAP